VAELVAVGRLVVLAPAAVVTGAAVAAAVVVTELSEPLLQPAAARATAIVPSRMRRVCM
jgi:hypothetical protein